MHVHLYVYEYGQAVESGKVPIQNPRVRNQGEPSQKAGRLELESSIGLSQKPAGDSVRKQASRKQVPKCASPCCEERVRIAEHGVATMPDMSCAFILFPDSCLSCLLTRSPLPVLRILPPCFPSARALTVLDCFGPFFPTRCQPMHAARSNLNANRDITKQQILHVVHTQHAHPTLQKLQLSRNRHKAHR